MPENDSSSQERTEEPTQKKLDDARKKGEVARSRESAIALVTIVGFILLIAGGEYFSVRLMVIYTENFQFDQLALVDPRQMPLRLWAAFELAFFTFLPFFSVLFVASIVGSLFLGGWNFSLQALQPKLNRMDPLKGLKRMFSAKALMELSKALAKFLLVTGVSVLLLWTKREAFMSLIHLPFQAAVVSGVFLVASLSVAIACSLIIVAIADVLFQRWSHQKQMRMTKQEVKDEMKDTEGKPEVKQKLRQMQMDVANKRMMDAVPEADVIITNPEHFAVALKYDQSTMQAPILVAKGADLVAMRIKQIAKENNVVIVESPMLARAVFYNTEVNQEIPSGLYLAVAQVLAYIFQLQRWSQQGGQRPLQPDFPVPNDLRRDVDGRPLSDDE